MTGSKRDLWDSVLGLRSRNEEHKRLQSGKPKKEEQFGQKSPNVARSVEGTRGEKSALIQHGQEGFDAVPAEHGLYPGATYAILNEEKAQKPGGEEGPGLRKRPK